jgi:hypothetical protein
MIKWILDINNYNTGAILLIKLSREIEANIANSTFELEYKIANSEAAQKIEGDLTSEILNKSKYLLLKNRYPYSLLGASDQDNSQSLSSTELSVLIITIPSSIYSIYSKLDFLPNNEAILIELKKRLKKFSESFFKDTDKNSYSSLIDTLGNLLNPVAFDFDYSNPYLIIEPRIEIVPSSIFWSFCISDDINYISLIFSKRIYKDNAIHQIYFKSTNENTKSFEESFELNLDNLKKTNRLFLEAFTKSSLVWPDCHDGKIKIKLHNLLLNYHGDQYASSSRPDIYCIEEDNLENAFDSVNIMYKAFASFFLSAIFESQNSSPNLNSIYNNFDMEDPLSPIDNDEYIDDLLVLKYKEREEIPIIQIDSISDFI